MTLNRFGKTIDATALRAAAAEAIEAGGGATTDDFHLDAIVDALVTYSREHDGVEMDEVDFWALVETNSRAATGEHVATYTQEGHITIDGRPTGWTFDADGGTWEDEVRDALRAHGFAPSGEWATDAEGNSTITVADVR